MNNTIKIFLASSAELKDDRVALENFIGRENKLLQQEDTFLHLDIWEDFIDAISQTRLQDEYNKKIQAADIFVMLFFTKVGMYTSEEFDKALEQFKKADKPLIYTYFKNAAIEFGSLSRKDANSVWDFQDKLKSLGHFQTIYKNDAELRLHFSEQLDKLFAEGVLKKGKIVAQEKITAIPKSISAGQPAVTGDFLGRETELADVKSKLAKNGLLMITAEGGMGKTTLAAKYLNNNLDNYKHFAWLFCDNGINEEIITLAPKLDVDLTKYSTEEDQLLAIKTAMENLDKDCLLILDNANDPKHIEAFQKHFGGLHWHVLLTSRCQNVLPGNEYVLNHLKAEDAKVLFKTFYNENTPEFEQLLDKFLTAVGYNTLMIEMFSKNLHELSALGETFANTLQQFEQKGLFLGERSFEIKTAYTGNIHKEAATTDQIVEVLYDLTKLEETETGLLINLSLMPAESHKVSLLVDVLTPEDKFIFLKQLKSLAQKGWLNTDGEAYRISTVVQQIILTKNNDELLNYADKLIDNLNFKLENDGVESLLNLPSYAEAQKFADLTKSVIGFINTKDFKVGILTINLSDYYKNIGNFKASIVYLNKAAETLKEVSPYNYAVCLERLGDYALAQNETAKAEDYYVEENKIFKELADEYPEDELSIHGVATSYVKLGDTSQAKGDLEEAFNFFDKAKTVCKDLVDNNSTNELIQRELAISYQRIGDVYQLQKNFEKALEFFNLSKTLNKKMVEENPTRDSLKGRLSVSYERIGALYREQEDYEKALEYFKLQLEISEDLFEADSESVVLHNSLAISYSMIGHIYLKLNQAEKTKDYYLKAQAIWIELSKSAPEIIDFQTRLDWVNNALANL